VATGYQALFTNTTGRRNVAEGNAALYSNTIGNFNVAVGDQALFSLATTDPSSGNGNANTAIGWGSMGSLTIGGGNTALGHSALGNSTTGYQNIALGYVAGQNFTDGNNNIYISDPAIPSESNTIRIGNVVPFTDIYGLGHAAQAATYIAGINGATASGGTAVFVNTDGKLGTLTSSARFKTDIRPMDNASEAILALKPVTFRYKQEIDNKGIPQFGLVAEDVEKANPDLIARDREGKPYSVRYEAVNAMLLNEFLKEHRKVEQQDKKLREQQATIADLKSGMQALISTVKEQASQIQKVSAQVELQKRSARTVASKP
jgi:hypothetical protein